MKNAGEWHSYWRWNADRKRFSGVVFGDGQRFTEGIRYLTLNFRRTRGTAELYFGDLNNTTVC